MLLSLQVQLDEFRNSQHQSTLQTKNAFERYVEKYWTALRNCCDVPFLVLTKEWKTYQPVQYDTSDIVVLKISSVERPQQSWIYWKIPVLKRSSVINGLIFINVMEPVHN